MKYKRNATGGVERAIDLLGNQIPIPIVLPGPVKYEGFTPENLPANPSPEMRSLIEMADIPADKIPSTICNVAK